jgi:hypothetical protein
MEKQKLENKNIIPSRGRFSLGGRERQSQNRGK